MKDELCLLCGLSLEIVPQFDAWFCKKCRKYYPKEKSDSKRKEVTKEEVVGILEKRFSIKKEHKLNYKIEGLLTPYIDVLLEPGQSVFALPAALLYRAPSIKMELTLFEPLNNIFEEHQIVLINFTGPGNLGFSSPYNGMISLIELDKNSIMMKTPYLLLYSGTLNLNIANEKLATVKLQNKNISPIYIEGSGTVFIHAPGEIMTKNLKQNESIIINANAFIACDKMLTRTLNQIRNIHNIYTDENELFTIKLEGPGKVWFTPARQ